MGEDNDWDLGVSELMSGEHSAMAGNDTALRVDQNRIDETELRNAACDLSDLLGRVRSGIASIRDQPIYWPKFDLKRWYRDLGCLLLAGLNSRIE